MVNAFLLNKSFISIKKPAQVSSMSNAFLTTPPLVAYKVYVRVTTSADQQRGNGH